jgi:hypothetical protein
LPMDQWCPWVLASARPSAPSSVDCVP